jgi:hypothetical protein
MGKHLFILIFFLQDFTISIWNASSETWLCDLDFLSHIPAELVEDNERLCGRDLFSAEVSDIAIRQEAAMDSYFLSYLSSVISFPP